MSKIQKELSEVTEITLKRGGERQAFLISLLKAIAKLTDKEWDGLSQESQDWFNKAADAMSAKAKTVPDFPDLPADEEEDKTETKSSRRGKAEKAEPSVMKVGSMVKLTTKRGKVYEGTVIELDKEVVVLKTDDGEEELALDRIESKEIFHGEKPDDDAADEPADPIKVGVEVKLVTKRGKEITGKIVELDDDVIVLDVDGKDEEFDRSRVESVTPVKAAKEEAKPSRRGKAKDEDAGDSEKPKRSTNAPGVSIGTRIKELIAEDLDATEEQIAKILKKEGLEFRENTLKLNYSDCHKFIEVLRAAKLLKK